MATHIILTYKSQDTAMLFRASDGMCLGQYKNETVVYGEEPNRKTSRVFVDKEHAARFLREKVTEMDLRKTGLFAGTADSTDAPVEIEDRDGEGQVILAPNSIELPGAGGPRAFRN